MKRRSTTRTAIYGDRIALFPIGAMVVVHDDGPASADKKWVLARVIEHQTEQLPPGLRRSTVVVAESMGPFATRQEYTDELGGSVTVPKLPAVLESIHVGTSSPSIYPATPDVLYFVGRLIHMEQEAARREAGLRQCVAAHEAAFAAIGRGQQSVGSELRDLVNGLRHEMRELPGRIVNAWRRDQS